MAVTDGHAGRQVSASPLANSVTQPRRGPWRVSTNRSLPPRSSAMGTNDGRNIMAAVPAGSASSRAVSYQSAAWGEDAAMSAQIRCQMAQCLITAASGQGQVEGQHPPGGGAFDAVG